MASLLEAPLEAPRGRVHYSNPAYALAAVLVEKASGGGFLRERIFAPAGMTRTGFTGDFPSETAVGYGGPLAEA